MVKTLAMVMSSSLEVNTTESYCPLLSFSNQPVFRSITSRARFFSLYLSTGDGQTSVAEPLTLWRHNLGFASCLQLELIIRNLLIQLDIGIFRQAIIAR